MTGALVAGVLILSAVGSLLWAVPSKSDRRRADMRSHAMQSGLSVITLTIPDTSIRGRIERRQRLVTAYKKRAPGAGRAVLPELLVLRTEGEHGYGLPEGWVWREADFRLRGHQLQLLLDALEDLPDWVECFAVLPDGVAMAIEEYKGEVRVDELAALLRTRVDRLYEVIS